MWNKVEHEVAITLKKKPDNLVVVNEAVELDSGAFNLRGISITVTPWLLNVRWSRAINVLIKPCRLM
jgi:hypothetical protein